jgi:hypothetical protein
MSSNMYLYEKACEAHSQDLRREAEKVPKRPQTNDLAHHSTPSRHVRSRDEQAPFTRYN